MSDFVYRAARKDCIGRSDQWVMQAVNEILQQIKQQINATGKAPNSEQLDRIETVLKALTDELKARGK